MPEDYFIIARKYLPSINKADHRFCDSDGYYHLAYCTVNIINNKFYIGAHSTKSLEDGYVGSGGRYFLRALRKYGRQNFYRFDIKFFVTSLDAYSYEESVVSNDMIYSNECYNEKGGGKGSPPGKLNQIYKIVAEGRHNWSRENCKYEDHPAVLASRNGTHWWDSVDNHPMKIRSSNGTHPWLTNHPWKDVPAWKRPSASERSLAVWWLADEIYNVYNASRQETKIFGYRRLRGKFLAVYEGDLLYVIKQSKLKVWQNLVDKFREGFIPAQDSQWVEFKREQQVSLA